MQGNALHDVHQRAHILTQSDVCTLCVLHAQERDAAKQAAKRKERDAQRKAKKKAQNGDAEIGKGGVEKGGEKRKGAVEEGRGVVPSKQQKVEGKGRENGGGGRRDVIWRC